MIANNSKNHVYLSGLLPEKHPAFCRNLQDIFDENGITHSFIPNTKDIWCRDYMPIQNALGDFIQFNYNPSYLKSKTYAHTKTDVAMVLKNLHLRIFKSNIVLDGGNIVFATNKVLMCDKILKENPNIKKEELIYRLRYLFRVNHVLFIPTPPDDIFGHADGIVHLRDKSTVLVSDLSEEYPQYWKELTDTLLKYKLKVIKVLCNTKNNRTTVDATGIYINFLHVGKLILLPSYGLPEDKIVEDQFKLLYPKYKIQTIASNSIAKKGGVLNCVTWTIEKNYPHPLTIIERELNGESLNYYREPEEC